MTYRLGSRNPLTYSGVDGKIAFRTSRLNPTEAPVAKTLYQPKTEVRSW